MPESAPRRPAATLSAWWHRRWQRRIVARGGHIASRTQPAPVPFTPTPVDEAAATAWVTDKADSLVPGAVDEALGHALDNAINARADQWIALVHSEFAQHIAGLRYMRDHADSAVAQEIRLQPPDTHRVIETETARNAAAVRLRGDHDKPGWTEPGHADPTMLAGRPRGSSIYVIALILAAAADIAAFYQVVELSLNLSQKLGAVLVVGFTGVTLALAHFIGRMLRDRKAGAKWIQGLLIVIVTIIWLALGALAYWVRLKSGGSLGGYALPGTQSSGAGSTQGTPDAAAMFAGLYAATGAVAAVGAYLTHNPLRDAFARSIREHRRAAEDHGLSAGRLRLAEAEREFYVGQMTAALMVRDEAVLARHALAAELKQLARLEIARHLRDASTTDAFLDDDARPYTYRPFPN
jgi:heme/copper-type cytochrome/quinol oxidase subunit 4